jgi:Pectate lyase superfamily protein
MNLNVFRLPSIERARAGIDWSRHILLLGTLVAMALAAPSARSIIVVDHSSVDLVYQEALSPFPSWANVMTAYGATGNGSTDDTAAIQACLSDMTAAKQQVCYFPPGTYKITSTLTQTTAGQITGRMIGADPATTKILWAGPSGGTMLTQTSGLGAGYERITWDGANTAQVGVGEWYNTALYPGLSSSAALHQDEVFQNMGIGIMAGRTGADYGVNDSEGLIRRVSFINDSIAGFDTGSGNAVNWWIWESTFANCGTGVGNTYGYYNTLGDTTGSGAMYVYRSNFSGSTFADFAMGWSATSWFSLHNNFSTGSAAFINSSSAGLLAAGAQIIAENNRVVNLTGTSPISDGNAGPPILLDNQFGNTGPVYDMPSSVADIMAIGNTTYGSWPSAAAGQRLVSINNSVVASGSISTTAPTLPATPSVTSHTVFEVPPGASTSTIQGLINSANASSDPQAIVHFGGLNIWTITSTLTIPVNSHVQLVGDGWNSILVWAGGSGGTMIQITNPSKVTIRELRLQGPNGSSNTVPIAAVASDNVGGRVQIVGSVIDGLSATNLVDTQISMQANPGMAPAGNDPANTAVNLSIVSFAMAIGTNAHGTLVMSGVSNYIMEDTWFEGTGAANSMFDIPNGSFTYLGGILAPAADSATANTQTVPPVLISGGWAHQSYIGMNLNLANVDVSGAMTGVEVQNETASTSAYFYGLDSGAGELNWFSRPGPNNGDISFVINRENFNAMPYSGQQYPNTGDTSNSGILQGFAQARNLSWDTTPYVPPPGTTDLRIYRVMAVDFLTGVQITN